MSLPAPGGPGRYMLERDGDAVDATEVLALDARESDLRAGAAAGVPAEAEERDEGSTARRAGRGGRWWCSGRAGGGLLRDAAQIEIQGRVASGKSSTPDSPSTG